MLGDISPQTVRITQQAVVYPGRDHVTSLRVERFDGRTYKPVDMTAVTRVILSFPEADPVIVYDSSVQAVFTHVGATLTVGLSDYAMPASVLGCQIILYDAEHPAGQVLVDDIDAVVQFDFRNVSPVGGIPAPAVDYLTDAPIDGVTYARKDGLWVPVDALVSGVSSVNGQGGVVVLDAADVGADAAGTATTAAAAAVAAHTALADPHPQYLTPAEASSAYAPLAHVGSGGAAHANAIAAGAAGFMTGADKTKLDGVAAGATQNSADATLLARANHTGTQTASTISDFASASRAQTEAELVAGTNVTITPSGSGATRQLTIAAAGGGGSTNLSTTTSTTTLTVNSDTGTDAVLPAATPSVAGVLTAADKTKLDGVAVGATANANTDSLSEGATNKYFTENRVLATLMTGLTLIAGGAVSAADSLLVAIGKLQKQINDAVTSIGGKQNTLVSGTSIKTVNGSTLLGAGDLATIPAVRAITGNETLALANTNTFGVNATTNNYVSTIPAQASVAWTADAELHFLTSNTGDITITAAAGVSLNGVVAGSLTLSTQNGAATLKRTGADSWWLGGVIGTAAEQRAALGLGNVSGINRLINGAFLINQLALSGTVTLSAGAYGHDGWKAGASGCTYTFATSANVTTLTITAGSLQQIVEGVDLQSGTYTLSWVGTAQGKIGAGSYSASGVTGSATGGTNLTVEFNTGTLALVQFQAGAVALPFELRQYGVELALCQQYYAVFDTAVSGYTLNGFSTGVQINFAVTMRSIPTTTLVQGSKAAGFGDSTASGATIDRVIVSTLNSSGASGNGYSNAVIKCSARL